MRIGDMSREELIKGYIRGLNKTELKARLGQHGITSKISRLNKKGLGDLLIKEVLYNSEQISFDFESLPEEVEVKEVVKVELNNQLCLPAPREWIGDLESDEYMRYVGNEWSFDHTDKPTCLGWTKDQELELIIDRFYSMECSDFMLENTEMFLDLNSIGIGVNPIYLLHGTKEFSTKLENRSNSIKIGTNNYYEDRAKRDELKMTKLIYAKRRIATKIHPDTRIDKYKAINNPMFIINYINTYIAYYKGKIMESKRLIKQKRGSKNE